MSLGDAVAYQFNKNACKLLTDPSYRPTEKKWADWAEDRRDFGVDRHAGSLSPSGRGVPWRLGPHWRQGRGADAHPKWRDGRGHAVAAKFA